MKNRKSIAKRFKIKKSSSGVIFEHGRSNTNHNFRHKTKSEKRAVGVNSSFKKGGFKYRKLIYT